MRDGSQGTRRSRQCLCSEALASMSCRKKHTGAWCHGGKKQHSDLAFQKHWSVVNCPLRSLSWWCGIFFFEYTIKWMSVLPTHCLQMMSLWHYSHVDWNNILLSFTAWLSSITWLSRDRGNLRESHRHKGSMDITFTWSMSQVNECLYAEHWIMERKFTKT